MVLSTSGARFKRVVSVTTGKPREDDIVYAVTFETTDPFYVLTSRSRNGPSSWESSSSPDSPGTCTQSGTGRS